MIKQLLSTLIFLSSFTATVSAANFYNFSQSTQTYSNLSSATLVSNNMLWDDEDFNIPVSFPLTIYGITVTNLVWNNGTVYLDDGTYRSSFFAFGVDQVDRGLTTAQSPISYLVSGSVGSRILKIEAKNVGFYDGTVSDYMNYQIWLYEGSNKFEVRFGDGVVASPVYDAGQTGPYVGMAKLGSSNFVVYNSTWLTGSSSSPSTLTPFSFSNPQALTSTPSNGTVYTFTPLTAGISSLKNISALSVYPNPLTDEGTISMQVQKPATVNVTLVDACGKTVSEIFNGVLSHSADFVLNRADLSAGVYYLLIREEERLHTEKILIQ